MKKSAELTLTIDQAVLIGGALNAEAKHFDNLVKNRTAPDQTKLVWQQAADKRRALTREVIAEFKTAGDLEEEEQWAANPDKQ